MLSLKTNKGFLTLTLLEKITVLFMCSLFLFSCVAYSIKNSLVFPIINSILLLASFFLFKGKYRLYSLFFSMPFIVFFNYKNLKIGSFYSYLIVVYCLLIFIEFFIQKRKTINKGELKRMIIIGFIAFYSLILTLFFSGISGAIKVVSIFAYMIGVSLFFFDKKANKNLSVLILLIALGMLIANILACFLLFIVKGNIAIQFLERFANKSYVLHYQANNASFRYPGLVNDPNYLGFYTLILTAIVVINFKKLKFKVLIAIVTLLLQIFPIIGESKNYFLVVVIMASLGALWFLKMKRGPLISISILVASLIILLVFGKSILLPVILRLINIDSRDGFLNAITTGRTTIQLMYFNEYLSHPSSFLIGRGFSSLLNNASAHSVYVMSFWYFGIVGTILYYVWLFSFIPTTPQGKKLGIGLPLLIMAFYALSLDYISYSETFLFLLFLINLSAKDFKQTLVNKELNYYEVTI